MVRSFVLSFVILLVSCMAKVEETETGQILAEAMPTPAKMSDVGKILAGQHDLRTISVLLPSQQHLVMGNVLLLSQSLESRVYGPVSWCWTGSDGITRIRQMDPFTDTCGEHSEFCLEVERSGG